MFADFGAKVFNGSAGALGFLYAGFLPSSYAKATADAAAGMTRSAGALVYLTPPSHPSPLEGEGVINCGLYLCFAVRLYAYQARIEEFHSGW